MASTRLQLIAPWRALLQGCAYLLWFGLPFLRPGGVGMLRLDLPRLTLELGGARFSINELFLLLLLVVTLLLLFLFLTLALGRVWCGWGCPQTALVDLTEWCARRIGINISAGRMSATRIQQLALHLFYLALALLVGASLVWYFIPPLEFFVRLAAGRLGLAATLTLLSTAGLVYLDLALLRRLVCREFCPYGRFQAALIDSGTLSLRFHPDEAPRCIRCGACVRACPVGIDIRRGYQIECINCGRCLDACRRVMYSRRQSGIIRYTFGLGSQGVRALYNPRMFLVTAALLTALAILFAAALSRVPATLKLARSAAPPRSLGENRTAVFYTVYLQNRTDMQQQGHLQATLTGSDTPLELLGPVDHLTLAPGERRKIDFAVTLDASPPSEANLSLHLLDRDNRELASAEAQLPRVSLPEK